MRVTLKRSWGTGLDVVNNARVSFGKEHKVFTDGDKSLIKYLASGVTEKEREEGKTSSHTHWAPFANGIGATFHFKIPLFVAAQLKKHQVGFTVSEISRRYVTDEPEFYVPDVWRKAADNIKQGSSDEAFTGYLNTEEHDFVDRGPEEVVDYLNHHSLAVYDKMISKGVCPEQARMVLPQSMYTEIIMSGSLYGWANVYNQRSDPHAQKEIQMVAEQINEECKVLWPVSWAALTGKEA